LLLKGGRCERYRFRHR
jgi:hypothetical protein